MTKAELITEMSNRTKETKVCMEKAFNTACSIIIDAVARGEKVEIIGFGGFEARKQAARTIKTDKRKEPVNVPEKMVPKFKASKMFKEKVAELPVR